MMKQSLRIFLTLAALVILSASAAQAQSTGEQTARIPFAFSVGDKSFPAGEYRVSRVNPQSDRAALYIRSGDGRTGRIVMTTPVQADQTPESAKLVFNRYGDAYYLSQVWSPADGTVLELRQSRAERTLAKNLGGERPERQTVALASHRR